MTTIQTIASENADAIAKLLVRVADLTTADEPVDHGEDKQLQDEWMRLAGLFRDAMKGGAPAGPIVARVPFGSYNARRYSRPWGATVRFDGVKPVFDFSGRWDGEAVVFSVPVGAVVAYGQKDNRGGRSEKNFGVVQDDGTVLEVTEAVARAHAQGGAL